MAKKGNKRKRKISQVSKSDDEEEKIEVPSTSRNSDDPLPKKPKWINRQRALVFSSRGITQRDRHFIRDLRTLMPHSKTESKMESKEQLSIINEMCIMKNCNKAVFFQNKRRTDLYMWVSNIPNGPSAKFLVESIFTMGELKLSGNCLKGSRPILSFDNHFKTNPHYALLKELFIQVFGIAKSHPKSQPFFDKVVTFTVMDNRIWYRNYQILKEDGALVEIGPRFILNPIKIFGGSFGGETLWENPHYVTPAMYRRQISKAAGNKYLKKKHQKEMYKERIPKTSYPSIPGEEVFEDDPLSLASKITNQPLDEEFVDNQKALGHPPPLSFKKKKRAGKKIKQKSDA